MIEIIKHNPMLGVMAGLLLASILVSGLLGVFMARSDASLRPIVFVLITFVLVVLPQLIGHLAMAVKPGTRVDQAQVDARPFVIPGMPSFTITVKDGLVSDTEHVFGPSMPGAAFEDSRERFASRMPGLHAANTASLPTGETITALIFENETQATDGLLAYLGLYEVAVELDRGGAEVKGKRGLGQDRLHLLRSGSAVLIVTALNEAMLEARVASIPMLQPETPDPAGNQASASPDGVPLIAALQPLKNIFQATWIQLVSVVVLVLLMSIWFFKGVVWAGSVPAESTAQPLAEQALRQRLLQVNSANVPMTVEELPDGHIAITWNYADARWVDAMRAHRMTRTHRLLLCFEGMDRNVRVTEQWSSFDASAGMSGARLQWKAAMGITFFQIDHRKVYGLQFGPDGTPTGDLAYTYHFNLQDLKAPFIAAITQAGWTWKPVLLEAPPALRWAME